MEARRPVQLITEELISAVVKQAQQSARRRKNYNFHAGDSDNPQRFLNVFLAGSYVRPHRHLTPPKAESFLVLNGHVVVFLFDDAGSVVSGHILGDGPFAGPAPSQVTGDTVARGIDLDPGVWHCVASLTPVAVCYEVKPGPWDPSSDKEFAPWAPEEASPEAARYLAALLAPVGIHGVLSQVEKQRTGETGVRIALGPSRGRILASLLNDVKPSDPPVLAACYLPVRLDSISAFRNE